MEEKELEKVKDELKRRNASKFMTFVMWLIILFGFCLGVLYIFFSGEKGLDLLTEYFDKIIQNKYDKNILNLFLMNGLPVLVQIFIIFILGFSPFLSMGSSVLLFFKGLSSSLAIMYVYINYGFRGIIYESLINIPMTILTMTIIILASKQAIKFSSGIYRAIRSRIVNDISLNRYFLNFFIIFLLAIFLSLVFAAMDFIIFRYINIF